ncbi:putative F-box-like domain superfamily protein [Helianthus debilis subsp. tardiflorus]
MTTWSDLLPEILNRIAGKLDFYEDSVNFLCVCTSWKSSVSTTKTMMRHLPSRLPMLMLAESDTDEDDKNEHEHEHKLRRFFLLSNGGTMRKLPLPEAQRQRCVSTHGWLLTTGEEEFCAMLVYPLTRAQVDLPQLYMFDELYFDQDEWMYYLFSMRKVVFTSPNPLSSDPSFRVIIIWGRTIGFCRPRDASWTRINSWEGHLFDISYHGARKRLYVVATMGAIYECDVTNDVLGPKTLSRVTRRRVWVLVCSVGVFTRVGV